MRLLLYSVITCAACHALTDVIDHSVYESVPMSVYHSYENVWLFEYKVPHTATLASWTFKGIKSEDCPTKHIHVYIQYGSYPVISPLNESFPANFDVRRTYLHNVTVLANQTLHIHNMTNPLAGSWFAGAFLVEEDNDETVQKVTSKDCEYSLASNFTTVTTQLHDMVLYQNNAYLNVTVREDNSYFRFYLNRLTWKYRVKIAKCTHKGKKQSPCPLEVFTRSQALPEGLSDSDSGYVNCSLKDNCLLTVVQPVADQYTYLLVKKTPNLNEVTFELIIKTYECATDFHEEHIEDAGGPHCGAYKKLYRTSDILVDFAITYALKPTQMEYIENVVTLHSSFSRLFQFDVFPLLDSGGTLRLRVIMNMFNDSTLFIQGMTEVLANVTVCIQRGRIPLFGSKTRCSEESEMLLSSSDPELGEVVRYLPYPEPGIWYLAMNAVCYTEDDGHPHIVPCPRNVENPGVSIKFDLKLSSCVDGDCGKYGNCNEYSRGLYTFTSCQCLTGWRGYGCTDGTKARPDWAQLRDTLLLTMSNLFFIPGIILATYRRHYVEALVYFCNMFFSAFYHGCDMGPWSLYTLCIMPYHVLSYCDFFCSIMSFWVTLMAMAELRQPFYSLAHMLGAVALSMGVEWKQHGFIPYVVPICIGVVVVTISWGYRGCRKKMCYANRRQWLMAIPGLVLAGTGMSIFAFVETDDNYPYTHSAWHTCMGLCIVFFLPFRKKKDLGICGDETDSSLLELNDTDTERVNLVGSEHSRLAFKEDGDEAPYMDDDDGATFSHRSNAAFDGPEAPAISTLAGSSTTAQERTHPDISNPSDRMGLVRNDQVGNLWDKDDDILL